MKCGQPEAFAGWWEAVFYRKGGLSRDIRGIIEHIYADGRFEVFRDGTRVGGGRHVEFQLDPPGFTNVHETDNPFDTGDRELAIYRIDGDIFEVCKAAEAHGRPDQFVSKPGSLLIHAAIRRINEDDARVPVGAQAK